MVDEKRKERGIERLFDEADIISRYSDRQAVEDGVLFDVHAELSKLSPSIEWDKGPFQYVTTNLCVKGYVKDDQPNVANFLDLFRNAGAQIAEAMKTGPDHFYSAKIEFPDGT